MKVSRAGLVLSFLGLCYACRPAPTTHGTDASAPGSPSETTTTDAIASTSAGAPSPSAKPPWMIGVKRAFELRIGGKSMGEVTLEWEPLRDGGFRMTDRSTIAVKVAANDGAVSRSESEGFEEYSADLRLVKSVSIDRENGVEERAELTVEGGFLHAKVDKPSHREEKKVKLPEPWTNDMAAFVALRAEVIGGAPLPRETRYSDFDFDEMAFHTDTLKLLGREKFDTAAGPIDAWRIEQIDGKSREIVRGIADDAGLPLKAEFGAVSLTLRGGAGGSTEMAEIVSTLPIEGTLVTGAAKLEIEVTVRGDGATEQDLFVDSPYQSVTRKGDVYSITLHPRRAKKGLVAARLPIADLSADVARFLGPTAASQSEDEAIVARAKAIVGAERDSQRASRAIVQWVYEHLQKRDGARGAASAVETLAAGGGDCTEHTALTVALARAAGIPARINSGIVLVAGRKAEAGYHAWPEVWIGEWVAMDPALGTLDVGPTYLWLGYDEPSEPKTTGRLTRLIGRTSLVLK